MTDKAKKIRDIMKVLNDGKTVKIDNGTLWKGHCRVSGRQLIYWQHYGQSANRCNIKELTWIINTIFEKKRKDFSYVVE
jgi:hypothetical protein